MKRIRFITYLAIAGSLLCFKSSLLAQSKTVNSEHLNKKEQSTVVIASLTAIGDLNNLKTALTEGLEAGLLINEIKEVLVHTYAYSGFPRSIRGLQTFLDVLAEREEKGIKDTVGKEASPITDSRDKYSRGVETLEELVQAKLDGPKPAYQQFSPEIDVFLKEHLFADIFERDVLSYAQRELVTISVLSALGNLEPMLTGHFNICLNVGLSSKQLNEAVEIIKVTIGHEEAQSAQNVLTEVVNNRN
ncbi:MAG: carboxymuconolactone decarboxylase family protein [Cyclobacteriaceae bacterium]